MRESDRIEEILKRLAEHYPEARTALHFRTPLEILVATILSAQCTDERVNKVTPALFRKYPSAAHYVAAPTEELESDIRSTGFYHNKAKSIKGASLKIMSDFAGAVPSTMDELLSLPGVARKTANCVLSNAFGIAEGIVVDTHVLRVSFRLGLTTNSDAVKVERDLMKAIPRDRWIDFSHQVILHGRQVCAARKPRHGACCLFDLCPSRGL